LGIARKRASYALQIQPAGLAIPPYPANATGLNEA
jgi:hypothetical protein